jgi:hypothetical protein
MTLWTSPSNKVEGTKKVERVISITRLWTGLRKITFNLPSKEIPRIRPLDVINQSGTVSLLIFRPDKTSK